MKISLLGYMGSGKSTMGKVLAKKLAIKFIDLDKYIEVQENQTISDIFAKKGEIYFRKLEYKTLNLLLNSEDSFVLSLGGGTPVYYDAMEKINEKSLAIYLKLTPSELSNRLVHQKNSRPLIAHLNPSEIEEFIAKHLFERNPYYQKAKYAISAGNASPEELSDTVIRLLENP